MKKAIILNVHIISDHPLVAQQLKAILSAGRGLRARLEGETWEGPAGSPEVLLIDTTSTLQPVEKLVGDLASRYNGSKIVVISELRSSPFNGFRVLEELGVHGWLDHADLAKRLIPTVTAVASGMSCLPSSEIPQGRAQITNLTFRERQVFDLVRWRFSNREIAEELKIRECTVKSYVKRILEKLGSSRRDLGVKIRRGDGPELSGWAADGTGPRKLPQFAPSESRVDCGPLPRTGS
jgi:DNA-binding NarL/FixJ family response regulator